MLICRFECVLVVFFFALYCRRALAGCLQCGRALFPSPNRTPPAGGRGYTGNRGQPGNRAEACRKNVLWFSRIYVGEEGDIANKIDECRNKQKKQRLKERKQ